MERNFVSLETAKKLEAAGFPNRTFCSWYQQHVSRAPMGEWIIRSDAHWNGLAVTKEFWLAAPTAQEIADQLEDFEVRKYPGHFTARRRNDLGVAPIDAPTMAEALAALWLKLQESK